MLRGLWLGGSRCAACLMMAFVGACVLGVTSGIATITVYGIGIWLGAPAGLVLGLVLGWKMPKVDSLFIFAAGLGVWKLSNAVGPFLLTYSGDTLEVIAVLLGVIAAIVAFLARNKLGRRLKLAIGAPATFVLLVIWVVGFFRHIYE